MMSTSQAARIVSQLYASSSGRVAPEPLRQPGRRSTGWSHRPRRSSRHHRSVPLQVVTDEGSSGAGPFLESSEGMEDAEEPPRNWQEAEARADSRSKHRGRPTPDWRRRVRAPQLAQQHDVSDLP